MFKKKEKAGPASVPQRPRRTMDMYVPNQQRSIAARPALQPQRPTATVRPGPKLVQVTPAKRSSSDIEAPSAKFVLILLIVIIVLGSGGAASYYFAKYRPAHQSSTLASKAVVDSTNHITNDTLGIKFAIDKKFVAIDQATLVRQNPAFIYGYKPADVDNVNCTVSQQKKTSKVLPPADALRDGTMRGLKKSFPDIKLIDYQDITLTNDRDAASMVVTYTDINKVALKERLVVAATASKVSFAFCSSPKSLYDFYTAKFNPFFDSLEVY